MKILITRLIFPIDVPFEIHHAIPPPLPAYQNTFVSRGNQAVVNEVSIYNSRLATVKVMHFVLEISDISHLQHQELIVLRSD